MEIELKKNSKKPVNDYLSKKIWYKNFYLIDNETKMTITYKILDNRTYFYFHNNFLQIFDIRIDVIDGIDGYKFSIETRDNCIHLNDCLGRGIKEKRNEWCNIIRSNIELFHNHCKDMYTRVNGL